MFLGVIAGGAQQGGGGVSSDVLVLLKFNGEENSTDVVNDVVTGPTFSMVGIGSLLRSNAKSGVTQGYTTGVNTNTSPGEIGYFESDNPITLTQQFCIEFFYTAAPVFLYGGFIHFGDYNGSAFFDLEFANGRVDLYRESSAPDSGLIASSAVNLTEDQMAGKPHVAITRDDSNMVRVFWDGELIIGPVEYDPVIADKLVGLGGEIYNSPKAGMDSLRVTLNSPVYTDYPFVPPTGDYTPAAQVLAVTTNAALSTTVPLALYDWSSRGFGNKYGTISASPTTYVAGSGKPLVRANVAALPVANASGVRSVLAYGFGKGVGPGSAISMPTGTAGASALIVRGGTAYLPGAAEPDGSRRGLTVFDWTGTFGTKRAAAPLLAGRPDFTATENIEAAVSPNGQFLALASPNGLNVYLASGGALDSVVGVYGTTFTSIDGGTITRINSVVWHPAGGYIAVAATSVAAGVTRGHVFVYPWSGTALGGRTFTSVSGGTVNAVDFSTDGVAMAMAASVAPYLLVYSFLDGAVNTLYDPPADPPTAACSAVKFTHDVLLLGTNASPYIIGYRWQFVSGVGVRVPAPGANPGAPVVGIDFY